MQIDMTSVFQLKKVIYCEQKLPLSRCSGPSIVTSGEWDCRPKEEVHQSNFLETTNKIHKADSVKHGKSKDNIKGTTYWCL